MSADEMNWLLQALEESDPVSFFGMMGARSAVDQNWTEQ